MNWEKLLLVSTIIVVSDFLLISFLMTIIISAKLWFTWDANLFVMAILFMLVFLYLAFMWVMGLFSCITKRIKELLEVIK